MRPLPTFKLCIVIALVFVSTLMHARSAHAVTYMLDGGGGGGGGGGGATTFTGTNASYNINLDKSDYAPYGTITVTSTLTSMYCSNSVGDVTVTATVRNSGVSSVTIFSVSNVQGGTTNGPQYGYLTAPSTVGSYYVDLNIKGVVTGGGLPVGTTYNSTYSIPFTVSATPTGSISATNCTIPKDSYRCTSYVSWNSQNTDRTAVYQGGYLWSNVGASWTNNPYDWTTVNGITFTLYSGWGDTNYPTTPPPGGTYLGQATARGTCISGTAADASGYCRAIVPTGSISATNCTIPKDSYRCTSYVSWNSQNTDRTAAYQGGYLWSNVGASWTNNPYDWTTVNGITFTLYSGWGDTNYPTTPPPGGTYLGQAFASGSCTSGTSADASGYCRAACTLPWGGTIAHGSSVTAYQSAAVTDPSTCTSETRTCSSGTLSGSYTNQACWITYCTGGYDGNGYYWQWWKRNAQSTSYIKISDGNGTCVPPKPTLTATPTCSSGTSVMNLSWTSIAGASNYIVKDNGVQIYSGGATSYTQPNLTFGSSHSYTVSATANSGATSSGDSSAVAATASNCTATGTISASPKPCTISANSNTCTSYITWSTTNATNVVVEVNGSTFGTGLSYTNQPATSVGLASSRFNLRNNGISGTILSYVDVYGTCTAGTIADSGVCRPTLTASCSVSPSSGTTANTYTWSVAPSGGTGSYSYSWSGSDSLTGSTQSVAKTYSITGTKSGTVTITSGSQSTTQTCYATVNTPTGPDLTAGLASPTTAVAGTATTLSATISNIGNIDTDSGFSPSITWYTLFQVATAAGGGGTITDVTPAPANGRLAAGANVTPTVSYTFPSAGTYSIRACADKASAGDTGRITELNENNNCSSSWTTVTVSPAYGWIWGYKVGTTDTTVLNSQVRLNGGSGTTANPYTFANLSPGVSYTVDVDVPLNWAVGYTLCYNNTACHTNTPTMSKTVSAPVTSGQYDDLWWHYFQFTCANNAAGNFVPYPVSVTYTVTTPSVAGPYSFFDGGVGGTPISGCQNITSTSCTQTYSAAGSHTVYVTSPSGSASCGNTVTVIPGTPDLTISVDAVATPASPIAGQSVALSATAKNIGTAAVSGTFNNIFQVDTDTNHASGNEKAYAANTLSNTAVNGTGAIALTRTDLFPVSGTYYIRACTDLDTSMSGTITESNDGNNCGNWSPAITVQSSLSCTKSPTGNTFTGSTKITFTASGGTGSYTFVYPSVGGSVVCETSTSNSCTKTFAPNASPYQVNARDTSGAEYVCGDVPFSVVGDVTLSADPVRIQEGNSSTLTWSSKGYANSDCTVTGPNGFTSIHSANGNTSVSPTTQSTYKITCGTESKTVTINVVPRYDPF